MLYYIASKPPIKVCEHLWLVGHDHFLSYGSLSVCMVVYDISTSIYIVLVIRSVNLFNPKAFGL
jgi:hypothetical protein